MPMHRRALRRLSFLLPSVVLSYLAVSVIGFFEPVIEEITALAIFLPMVANLSGAAGNQSVAVSIRELSLGLVSSRDVWWVWVKEAAVGIANGILIGALLGGIVHIWRGDWALAGVVAIAYAMSCTLAVLVGGGLPLILRRFGVDPAMLASPILTTITDMLAFLFVLSLAKSFLLPG
jgi:magnesium transporter